MDTQTEHANGKIRRFTDLLVWQESHELVKMLYNLTKDFPKDEQFGLTSQMRRAAISVTSNIAEGFGRQTYKDKLHFYMFARGSLIELENQLIASRDIGYLNAEKYNKIFSQVEKAHTLLNGFMKKTKSYS